MKSRLKACHTKFSLKKNLRMSGTLIFLASLQALSSLSASFNPSPKVARLRATLFNCEISFLGYFLGYILLKIPHRVLCKGFLRRTRFRRPGAGAISVPSRGVRAKTLIYSQRSCRTTCLFPPPVFREQVLGRRPTKTASCLRNWL